jgi:predicted metal-dependent peptidase
MKEMLNMENLDPQIEENTDPLAPSKGVKKPVAPPVSQTLYTDDQFSKDFLALYTNEPFLGGISIYVTKRADPTKPTAYVTLRGDYELFMGYNPTFFASLSDVYRNSAIKHELYHITLGHLTDRAPLDMSEGALWNIALDLAVNSMIGGDKIHPAWMFPGRAPEGCTDAKTKKLFESLPQLQCADWYMNKLREHEEKNGQGSVCAGLGMPQTITMEFDENGNPMPGQGGGAGTNGQTLDDHSFWKSIPEADKDIIRQKVKGIVSEGVKRAAQRGSWGSIPAEVAEILKKLVSNEVDWKSIVRMFVGIARSMDRMSSMKRVNKKAPYVFPGCRRTTIAKFVAFIDQSGSMGDEDVQRMFAAIWSCSKEAEVEVYNFDTEVDESSHQTWKKAMNCQWKRTRCGGTDFGCISKFMNEKKHRGQWSGAFICTDGYAPAMGPTPGTRILWLITPDGTVAEVRPGDLVVKMDSEGARKTAERA